jgi:predicted kinase
MSGVSGSGKSTYAEKLLNDTQGIKVSADHFFTDSGGKYRFDAAKLGEAHADCFRRFIGYMQGIPFSVGGMMQMGRPFDYILVDNTCTRVEEISPYILAAQAFDYTPEIITLMPTSDQVEACWRRNTHGVPRATVEHQHHNLKIRQLPLWWKNTIVPVQF